ncbi:MAG: FHA domain-containing protein [Gemmatimonadaceae bacterium]
MEIAAIVGAIVVLIGVPVVVVNRDILFHRKAVKRARAREALPFLIVPTHLGLVDIDSGEPARHRASPASEISAPDQSNSFAPPNSLSAPAPPPQTGQSRRSQSFEHFSGADERDEVEEVDEMEDFDLLDREEELAPDDTIVFNRPVDEPMQILPGRFQVIAGEPDTEDLRFFSRLGEPPRIVVGRDTGPPHRHITLRSPTVSRRHARIDFDNGAWTITNLSQTNPVLVNDRVLTNGGSARKLSDGDRIELGEVALRFRSS